MASEISFDGAKIFELVNAARSARQLLKEEYGGILNSTCPKDADERPILAEIDGTYKALARRYRKVMKQLDDALDAYTPHVKNRRR